MVSLAEANGFKSANKYVSPYLRCLQVIITLPMTKYKNVLIELRFGSLENVTKGYFKLQLLDRSNKIREPFVLIKVNRLIVYE